MKTLYLECAMGAAGDMLSAALLELIDDKASFIQKMNSLGLPGVEVSCAAAMSCGIKGTHVSVKVNGEEEESLDTAREHRHEHQKHHSHVSLPDIDSMISALPVSEKVKADVCAVYKIIAEAESHVHGTAVEQVHFHELGTMDALADITAVCLLMEELSPEKVLCSPIHVGFGQVRCSHGIVPVPAPATAYILQGIPFYGGEIRGELCTPTGAALLKYFATDFCSLPPMRVSRIGYGMGMKDFGAANCVRALLGETEAESGEIIELRCNLDDMTGEAIGFATERLFEGGAVDVYTISAGMKKNRPGIILSCMCPKEKREELIGLMFKHTTTLGIREYDCRRYTLARSERVEERPHGSVRIKRSEGWGVVREKAEYEDLARIARETDGSII